MSYVELVAPHHFSNSCIFLVVVSGHTAILAIMGTVASVRPAVLEGQDVIRWIRAVGSFLLVVAFVATCFEIFDLLLEFVDHV